MASNIRHESSTNEWYSPPWVVRSALKVIGIRQFSLDPAASEDSMAHVNGEFMRNFYTKEDDGLAQKWVGDLWLNPPYGGKAGPFVQRASNEVNLTSSHVRTACVLVNSNTEVKYFHILWNYPIVFFYRRIKFVDAIELKEQESPAHGNALAIMSPIDDLEQMLHHYERAKEVFDGIGYVAPPQRLLEWAMTR